MGIFKGTYQFRFKASMYQWFLYFYTLLAYIEICNYLWTYCNKRRKKLLYFCKGVINFYYLQIRNYITPTRTKSCYIQALCKKWFSLTYLQIKETHLCSLTKLSFLPFQIIPSWCTLLPKYIDSISNLIVFEKWY